MNEDLPPPSSTPSSQSSSSVLHQLFLEEGGFIAPGVAAQAHPNAGGGFGVIANSKLRGNQTIASVPQNLWVTAQSSRKTEGLTKKGVSSPVAAICIHLCRERLRAMESMFEKTSDETLLLKFLPKENCGFSLPHVRLVLEDDNEKLPMMKDWVRRLPPQYDNLIQFAPHLEFLTQNGSGVTKQEDTGSKFMSAASVFDQSISELISANHFSPSNDEDAAEGFTSSSGTNNDMMDQSVFSSSTSISIGLQKAYKLPKRYADKTEIEIARWRKMALDHLKYLKFDSWKNGTTATTKKKSKASNDDDENHNTSTTHQETSFSSHLPPRISSVFHRLRESSSLHKRISTYFTEERMLIELFSWAYSSLMSRGFSHDDEVWLMQPWVDYFNYSPANSYNVSASMNYQTGRFELKAREMIRPNAELCLHYGTYSDFEIALWYGFTLCGDENDDDNGDGSKSENSSTQQHQNHQSECEYVFSPLADPDGEYSAEEFRRFVVQVVMLVMDMNPMVMITNDSSLPVTAAAPSRKQMMNVHQTALTVCRRMHMTFGVAAPRCAFCRHGGFVANDTFQFLCRKVCENVSGGSYSENDDDDDEILTDDESEEQQSQKSSAKKKKKLTASELAQRVIQFEVEHGFTATADSAESMKREVSSFIDVCASDITSPCSQFARRVGKDTLDLLKRGVKS